VLNLFISDLHLEESRPDITDIFIRFMHHDARQADALYILGDFFEAWVGDDDATDFNRSIFAALKAATMAGLPIYFMHGNRDFLIGKRFVKATGCRLLPDEYVVNLAGVPTLLMHGDSLCIEDVAYQKFRKKSRNWFLQKCFLLKSLKSRQQIAADMRAKSKMHTSNAPANVMDVTQSEVARVMLKHDVEHLIHGHTHRLAVHEFVLANKPATRTVLGAWHDHGNVLVCSEDGKQELILLS
jgi:UDP-2,3-diacylglucosamine hydrolase